ncbi:MAG: tetratricopeptide repeat protein [Gammaproteobacteria bacterium]|nr:tetratricopeptide repeat protein [Gammaproteobacteria bacterium]
MSGALLLQDGSERLTAVTSVVLVSLVAAMVVGFGGRSQFDLKMPQRETIIDAKADPRGHSQQYRQRELEERFQQAVAMLHAKKYDYAITALHRVIALAPRMPEAYVNMGYALIGMQNYPAARDFFNIALEIEPYQANAYWGLAVALEQMGDVEGALGAMRTFIHLSPPNDPYLRKARSALWEWESTLKRGPLPKDEQQWLEKRGREWTERNGPEADSPAIKQHEIDFSKR